VTAPGEREQFRWYPGAAAGGPRIGTLGIGRVAALTGPRQATLYPAAAMVAVLGLLLLRSGLWRRTAAPFARA